MKVPQINLVELLLELYLPRWESVKWCKEHNKYKIYPVNTTKHFLLNKKNNNNKIFGWIFYTLTNSILDMWFCSIAILSHHPIVFLPPRNQSLLGQRPKFPSRCLKSYPYEVFFYINTILAKTHPLYLRYLVTVIVILMYVLEKWFYIECT